MRIRKSAGFGRRDFMLATLATAGLFDRSSQAVAGDNSFPIAITHALGTTIVPAKPQRIVTLGWGGEDALLALGVTPFAMPRYSQFETGMLPWAEEQLGKARPILVGQGLVDFERIAMFEPDLILAVRTNIDAQAWRRLQRIAPTVAYRSGPLQADWKEITQLVGAAIGQADRARSLVCETEAMLRQFSNSHSAILGRTFVFGDYFPQSNALGFYLPTDGRVASLLDLGLRVAPGVERIAASTRQKIGASISLELLDTMQADILILWFPPGARQELESNALFKRFAPVMSGAYIALDDPLSMWVACNPSVLSIPYGFPSLVDRLAQAAVNRSRHDNEL